MKRIHHLLHRYMKRLSRIKSYLHKFTFTSEVEAYLQSLYTVKHVTTFSNC